MPKPKEYKAMAAWGKYLGSMEHYIEREQVNAAAENAPLDALYYRIGSGGHWVRVRDLARGNPFRLRYEAENPPEYSPQMQRAIAALVRDDYGDEPRSDEEVRGFGLVCGLTLDEIEQLVEIAQGPIGY